MCRENLFGAVKSAENFRSRRNWLIIISLTGFLVSVIGLQTSGNCPSSASSFVNWLLIILLRLYSKIKRKKMKGVAFVLCTA